ncbi:hypothetical protein [Roseibium sp. RKSG952]|uniref:hypothetical protein n=1 Tax=Roseibium sp. RKSG952 TaxID=2529384 RepID=UPI0012BC03C3|nr:hypothetical protein [Roseibium sp. RKSG952]
MPLPEVSKRHGRLHLIESRTNPPNALTLPVKQTKPKCLTVREGVQTYDKICFKPHQTVLF